jgi:hypothetical protein
MAGKRSNLASSWACSEKIKTPGSRSKNNKKRFIKTKFRNYWL